MYFKLKDQATKHFFNKKKKKLTCKMNFELKDHALKFSFIYIYIYI